MRPFSRLHAFGCNKDHSAQDSYTEFMVSAQMWSVDSLGDDFQQTVLAVPTSDHPKRFATLVRFQAEECIHPQRSVLFIHGWSDYFFNRELAEFFAQQGVALYAIDLHNHGRSLDAADHAGFVSNLSEYDQELKAALAVMEADGRERFGITAPPMLMGHSTGGLVAALWAHHNQGQLGGLILNSPWLEMHGSKLTRLASAAITSPMAHYFPNQRLSLPERNFYWRSISDQAQGEWNLDATMRPAKAFPIRFGWLRAIFAGQAEVARGLDIDVPIIVFLSARSRNGPRWSEDMHRADAVLDVRTIAARVLTLGASVTVERIDGGLHDIFLSEKSIRADAYRRMGRWLRLIESEKTTS